MIDPEDLSRPGGMSRLLERATVVPSRTVLYCRSSAHTECEMLPDPDDLDAFTCPQCQTRIVITVVEESDGAS